jgi:hypothetical protein
MTNDSKLFPPRDKWEERGYRPDEYSRWLRGDWRPIEELYAELGVKALPEGQRREAQPMYAHLPIARADIPEGIVLSRDGRSWIRESGIGTDEFLDKRGNRHTGPAIALPLYEGRMVGQFDFSQKGWVSGKGRSAVWREIPWDNKQIEPQYLMAESVYQHETINNSRVRFKTAMMDVTSATNTRTMINTAIGFVPACHKVPTLVPSDVTTNERDVLFVTAICSTLCFDYLIRSRLGGQSLVWATLDETAFLQRFDDKIVDGIAALAFRLTGSHKLAIPSFIRWHSSRQSPHLPRVSMDLALTDHERMRIRVMLEAIVAILYKLKKDDVSWILRDCAHPADYLSESAYLLDPKGFWRVQKTEPPESRLTVLSQIAFKELFDSLSQHHDVSSAITSFLTQNDGRGWELPERLRLSDYGLGGAGGDREVEVRSRFGERYYRWQEAQSVEESWRECHLHARNLLGPAGYAQLLSELASPSGSPSSISPQGIASSSPSPSLASSSPPPSSSSSASSFIASSSSLASSSSKSSSSTHTSSSSPSKASPTPSADSSAASTEPDSESDTFTLSNDPPPTRRKKRR